MTIYNKKEELCKKCKYLRELALNCNDFEISLYLRQKEEELYKKLLFYKNFLKVYHEEN